MWMKSLPFCGKIVGPAPLIQTCQVESSSVGLSKVSTICSGPVGTAVVVVAGAVVVATGCVAMCTGRLVVRGAGAGAGAACVVVGATTRVGATCLTGRRVAVRRVGRR